MYRIKPKSWAFKAGVDMKLDDLKPLWDYKEAAGEQYNVHADDMHWFTASRRSYSKWLLVTEPGWRWTSA